MSDSDDSDFDDFIDDFDESVIDLNIDPIILVERSVEYIEKVLENGYDVNKRSSIDEKESTLLLKICHNSDIYNEEKLKLVLKYGANVNDMNSMGIFVISGVIMLDKIDKNGLQILLDHGIDMFFKTNGRSRIQTQRNLESLKFALGFCDCDSNYICHKCICSEKIDLILNHDKKIRSLFHLMLDYEDIN